MVERVQLDGGGLPQGLAAPQIGGDAVVVLKDDPPAVHPRPSQRLTLEVDLAQLQDDGLHQPAGAGTLCRTPTCGHDRTGHKTHRRLKLKVKVPHLSV